MLWERLGLRGLQSDAPQEDLCLAVSMQRMPAPHAVSSQVQPVASSASSSIQTFFENRPCLADPCLQLRFLSHQRPFLRCSNALGYKSAQGTDLPWFCAEIALQKAMSAMCFANSTVSQCHPALQSCDFHGFPIRILAQFKQSNFQMAAFTAVTVSSEFEWCLGCVSISCDVVLDGSRWCQDWGACFLSRAHSFFACLTANLNWQKALSH